MLSTENPLVAQGVNFDALHTEHLSTLLTQVWSPNRSEELLHLGSQ